MDQRDVLTDQVAEIARKSDIKMLPLIGEPYVQVAVSLILPLLLQDVASEEKGKISGNLQRSIFKRMPVSVILWA